MALPVPALSMGSPPEVAFQGQVAQAENTSNRAPVQGLCSVAVPRLCPPTDNGRRPPRDPSSQVVYTASHRTASPIPGHSRISLFEASLIPGGLEQLVSNPYLGGTLVCPRAEDARSRDQSIGCRRHVNFEAPRLVSDLPPRGQVRASTPDRRPPSVSSQASLSQGHPLIAASSGPGTMLSVSRSSSFQHLYVEGPPPRSEDMTNGSMHDITSIENAGQRQSTLASSDSPGTSVRTSLRSSHPPPASDLPLPRASLQVQNFNIATPDNDHVETTDASTMHETTQGLGGEIYPSQEQLASQGHGHGVMNGHGHAHAHVHGSGQQSYRSQSWDASSGRRSKNKALGNNVVEDEMHRLTQAVSAMARSLDQCDRTISMLQHEELQADMQDRKEMQQLLDSLEHMKAKASRADQDFYYESQDAIRKYEAQAELQRNLHAEEVAEMNRQNGQFLEQLQSEQQLEIRDLEAEVRAADQTLQQNEAVWRQNEAQYVNMLDQLSAEVRRADEARATQIQGLKEGLQRERQVAKASDIEMQDLAIEIQALRQELQRLEAREIEMQSVRIQEEELKQLRMREKEVVRTREAHESRSLQAALVKQREAAEAWKHEEQRKRDEEFRLLQASLAAKQAQIEVDRSSWYIKEQERNSVAYWQADASEMNKKSSPQFAETFTFDPKKAPSKSKSVSLRVSSGTPRAKQPAVDEGIDLRAMDVEEKKSPKKSPGTPGSRGSDFTDVHRGTPGSRGSGLSPSGFIDLDLMATQESNRFGMPDANSSSPDARASTGSHVGQLSGSAGSPVSRASGRPAGSPLGQASKDARSPVGRSSGAAGSPGGQASETSPSSVGLTSGIVGSPIARTSGTAGNTVGQALESSPIAKASGNSGSLGGGKATPSTPEPRRVSLVSTSGVPKVPSPSTASQGSVSMRRTSGNLTGTPVQSVPSPQRTSPQRKSGQRNSKSSPARHSKGSNMEDDEEDEDEYIYEDEEEEEEYDEEEEEEEVVEAGSSAKAVSPTSKGSPPAGTNPPAKAGSPVGKAKATSSSAATKGPSPASSGKVVLVTDDENEDDDEDEDSLVGVATGKK